MNRRAKVDQGREVDLDVGGQVVGQRAHLDGVEGLQQDGFATGHELGLACAHHAYGGMNLFAQIDLLELDVHEPSCPRVDVCFG